MRADRGRARAAWTLKLLAGLLIFWLAFRDLDPRAVASTFGDVDPLWLAAAVAVVFLTVLAVAGRWAVLIGARGARQLSVLVAAVITSQVSNIVMPFRLGDAVRIGAVSATLDVPPAEVLGTVAIERLFDASLLALTAGLLVVAGSLPAFARAGMVSLVVASVAAIAAAIVAARVFRAGALAGAPRDRWLDRARRWAGTQAGHLLHGLERAARPRTAGLALLWSCAVMAGSVCTAWLVLRAFAIDAPAVSAAVVVIAVQAGSVVVPIPGAVGISQVLTVQTLRLWDVPEAQALAYALGLYLVARVPKIAVLPLALHTLRQGSEGRWR